VTAFPTAPALAPVLGVRTITPAEHLAFIRDRTATGGSASFLQTPAWAAVKPEWRAESIGWYDGDGLVGAALVLYRQLPKVRRYLAYLPEGPLVDWESEHLAAWLDPLTEHLKAHGAFGIRIGPPVVTGRWTAAQIKAGIADDAVSSLTSLPPVERSQVGARVVSQLHELGWRPQSVAGGFAAGQPQYNFAIPLVDEDGKPRSEDDVLAGMNQQWRRNIKKAAKAGVEVTSAQTENGAAPAELAAFHELYAHTAERDHFTPRPLAYFRTMFEALGAEEPDRIRLYLAHHEGDLVASTIWIRVGDHTWYSYGASSTEKRDVRGSNAVQWQMIRDSLAVGAHVYDLRGITDTLDSDDDHVGLIQFKVGTGGEAVEYAGEWDLPVNKALYAAFDVYMRRRG
jgi:lipid II:glycine glycyltransferase (peptidoglycan interpeptide bridge formation enzyme)